MSQSPPFRHITIIGVGLIGGSLGLAIRRQVPDAVVTGLDRPAVLSRAKRRGAIHRAETALVRALLNADLVILAVPPRQIRSLLPRVARLVPQQTLVTDVGSVKAGIMSDAQKLFPRGNFIGGHPMAGAEHSGILAAHPLLFENAIYVLTPLPGAPVRAFTAFVRKIGGRPLRMDPGFHDAVAAAVSHLPQLVAVALMNLAGDRRRRTGAYLQLGAGGFRDLTRIASSRFDLWKHILPANRAEVAKALRRLEETLARYRRAVANGDLGLLAREFHRSRILRSRIPRDMKGFLHPLATLEVFVSDKPGMLARLTGALARKNINIKDIELMKVREDTGGTFRLSFESAEEKKKAQKVLRLNGFSVGR